MEFTYENVNVDERLPVRLIVTREIDVENKSLEVKKHWHESLEIIYIKSGKMSLMINNKLNALHNGDYFLVSSNEIHSTKFYREYPVDMIVVQIPMACFEGYTDEEYIEFNCNSISSKVDNISEILNRLHETKVKKEYGYMLKVNSLIYDLKYALLTECKSNVIIENKKTNKSQKNINRISQITDYIKNNYKEDISILDVADKFNISTEHLSRLLKKYTGVTYKKYLTSIRLQSAYHQLLNTDLPIIDISYSCGFSNPRAFSNAFKEKYNILPNKYRKNIR